MITALNLLNDRLALDVRVTENKYLFRFPCRRSWDVLSHIDYVRFRGSNGGFRAVQLRLSNVGSWPNSDVEKWCEQLTSNKATDCAQHGPSTCCAPWLLMHDSCSLIADPCHPQTSRAVSTTNLIFAACVSAAIALPSTVLENPHCGDKHSCSSGT